MTDAIRVLVADDHTLFRRGLMGLLNEQPDIQPVGEAPSGPEAVRLCAQLRPDVVLLDVHMPEGGGVEAVRALKQSIGARVLMLTVSEKDEDLLGAIQAGADGYLLKSAEPDQLCQAIRQVAAGQAILSPEVTARVMRVAAGARSQRAEVSLSRREGEILAALARGATTGEIAAQLVISESTVKTHVRHILEKLGASNRAEAVGRAAALGLIHDTA